MLVTRSPVNAGTRVGRTAGSTRPKLLQQTRVETTNPQPVNNGEPSGVGGLSKTADLLDDNRGLEPRLVRADVLLGGVNKSLLTSATPLRLEAATPFQDKNGDASKNVATIPTPTVMEVDKEAANCVTEIVDLSDDTEVIQKHPKKRKLSPEPGISQKEDCLPVLMITLTLIIKL